jgi:hypothetical protein
VNRVALDGMTAPELHIDPLTPAINSVVEFGICTMMCIFDRFDG